MIKPVLLLAVVLVAGAGWPVAAHAWQSENRLAQAPPPEEKAPAVPARFYLTTASQTLNLTLPEADRVIRTTFAEEAEDRYHTAAQIYLGIVGVADSSFSKDEQAIVDRHLRQLRPLLSERLLARLEARADGVGDELVRWWRAKDPLPATAENERIHEHLRRIAIASEKYRSAAGIAGYDERGDLFVRLGEPSHKTEVLFDQVSDRLLRPGLTVSVSDFVDNELWVYHHVDRAATYLFVDDDGTYVEGEVFDLLPTPLRHGFSAQGRGAIKAERMLYVLRAIYRQLSQLSDDFALRYVAVDDYIMRVEEAIGARESRQAMEAASEGGAVRTGVAAFRPLGSQASDFAVSGGGDSPFIGSLSPPYVFADGIVARGKTEDDVLAMEREKVVPRQFTDVLRNVPPLDVAARTARFLADDGSTRTDLYWAPLPGGLMPTEEQLDDITLEQLQQMLVVLTAVQQHEDYRQRVVNLERYLVNDVPSSSGMIPPQKLTVEGDRGTYHLGLQWEQFLIDQDETGAPTRGDLVKVFASVLDSMQALNPDERVLEASDLVPSVTLDEVAWDEEGNPIINPYPFGGLTPETPLALYFEVYHLTLDGEGRSNYTVEHEVVRRAAEETLWSALSGEQDLRSFSTDVTGGARTSREFILLDLADWDGGGEIQITVRVTDNLSGQVVERDITFASILVPQVNGE